MPRPALFPTLKSMRVPYRKVAADGFTPDYVVNADHFRQAIRKRHWLNRMPKSLYVFKVATEWLVFADFADSVLKGLSEGRNYRA